MHSNFYNFLLKWNMRCNSKLHLKSHCWKWEMISWLRCICPYFSIDFDYFPSQFYKLWKAKWWKSDTLKLILSQLWDIWRVSTVSTHTTNNTILCTFSTILDFLTPYTFCHHLLEIYEKMDFTYYFSVKNKLENLH